MRLALVHMGLNLALSMMVAIVGSALDRNRSIIVFTIFCDSEACELEDKCLD